MKTIDYPQLSQEWFDSRIGVPTASNFDKIVTSKGVACKGVTRQKYLYRLAGEKISGVAEETYQNAAMLRGIELEPEARNLYTVITGRPVEETGLCLTEGNYIFGASLDGLVNGDGCIEIKCPSLSVHVEYLMKNKLPTAYVQQVQGQLLVTERKWSDFVSYYPGIKPLIVRVERDEEFIEALRVELIKACIELNEIIEKIT